MPDRFRQAAASVLTLGERLYQLRVTNERNHHKHAEQEEQALRDVYAVFAEIKQIGDGPAAGEGGAEHLGADQDRRAHHREHVDPDDLAAAGMCGWLFHGKVLVRRALSPKPPACQGRMAAVTPRRAWL